LTWQDDAPEGVKEGLVQQEVDIFSVVVRLIGSVHLLLGLSRVNTFKDAQPPGARGRVSVRVAIAALRCTYLNSDSRNCSFLIA
jgi:hypothetical protein